MQEMQNVDMNNQPPQPDQPMSIATAQEKEKMSKKQIIGMSILSIVAVAGVIFGVYGMNSQNQEIEKLKVQVAEATTGQKTELETDKITITSPDGTTTEITDSAAIANSEDYVYVGEWGIKIKIPENLSEVSYIYNNGHFGSLCLTGAKYDGQQYGPEFLNIFNNYLGCITRVANYQNTIDDREYNSDYAVYKDGDYYWVYQGPQAFFSENESEQQWEYESSQLIKEMLENSNNYSKI